MSLLHLPHVRGVGAAGRMPCVAQLERTTDCPVGAAADPDLRPGRRVRLGSRVPVRPVAALERRVAAPERAVLFLQQQASASQNGWGPSFGVGGQLGLTRHVALRLDWDRYRFKLPGGGGDRENVDTLTLGAQYTFGGPR